MAGLSKSSSLSLVFVFLFFMFSSEAREILVGGKSDSWSIPSSEQSQSSLNQWAQSHRFVVGDTLVFNFDSGKDSVLEVTKDAFRSCNTTSPIAEHKESETKVELTRSGPYYFISGAQGHCEKGQKVEIVVLSGTHHRHLAPSPAPSPSELLSPALAPSSGSLGLRGSAVVGSALGFMVFLGLF